MLTFLNLDELDDYAPFPVIDSTRGVMLSARSQLLILGDDLVRQGGKSRRNPSFKFVVVRKMIACISLAGCLLNFDAFSFFFLFPFAVLPYVGFT